MLPGGRTFLRKTTDLSSMLAALIGLAMPACTRRRPGRSSRAPGPPEPDGVGRVPAASGAIPGSYIVVFKPEVSNAAAGPPAGGRCARHAALHLRGRLKGFAADLPGNAVGGAAAESRMWRMSSRTQRSSSSEEGLEPAPPAPWGLDRVDQRTLPLSASYTWGTSGTGVHVYIIDTGIRTTHADFGGRAVWAFSAREGEGRGPIDCHGHGTHVAGTVGGTTYGVAKGV